MITTLNMLWKGLGIGVIISAPMGPVGMLCIQKTIAKGRRAGLLTGCGAALSDILYCLLTGFGLSLIEDFLERNQSVIQLLGSLVLLVFGIYLYRQKQQKEKDYTQRAVARASVRKDALGGFLFTLSNPLIIFLIIGLFAQFNFLSPGMKFYHYIAGYIAILAGALAWWWVVTFTINKLRTHFTKQMQIWVNRIIGIIIMIFALVGIASASSSLFAANTSPPDLCVKGETYLSNITLDDIHTSQDSENSLSITLPDTTLPCRVLFHISPQSGRLSAKSLLKGMTHSDKSKSLWRLTFHSEYSDAQGISIECLIHESNPAHSFNSFAETQFKITFPDGNYELVSVPGHSATSSNAVLLTRSEQGWTLAAGSNGTKPVFEIPNSLIPEQPTSATLTNLTENLIEIPYLSVRVPENMRGRALTKSLYDYLDSVESTPNDTNCSNIEGEWKLLNAEYDTNSAYPGGDYTIHIKLLTDNVHLIEYIEGATKSQNRWREGSMKGVLFNHATPGNYYLYWIDSDGALLNRNLTATYNHATGCLEMNFPMLATTLTFTKM